MGLVSFALLMALEIVTEEDELALLDLVVDAASILLTIAAAVGVALLAQRLDAQHEEKLALIQDLEIARGWRWLAGQGSVASGRTQGRDGQAVSGMGHD